MTLRFPPKRELQLLRQRVLAWHRRHGAPAPWRESGDAYRVLVAAVMAQQTQMSRVLPKYHEFVRAFPTARALARAPTAEVLRRWAPLGYNLRALRLQRAAQHAARNGGFPRTTAELERMEGVGPFTAAVIASFAFGEAVAAVDTNVQRVIGRLLGNERLSGRALREAAQALLARRASARWNQALMDLGAAVCLARRPRCAVCPLVPWCRARPGLAARGTASARTTSKRRQAPFRGSRRYYRGRIIQALRELPPGGALTIQQLLARLTGQDRLDIARLRELITGLEREGLVRRLRYGRLALPERPSP